MRHLLLTVLIVFGNLTHVAAQTMLIMAPFTYPEFGTFCGFLKLCPKVVEPSDDTQEQDQDRIGDVTASIL